MLRQTKYQKKIKLKKGDEVIVISGSCRGQKAPIDRVDYKKDRVYLAGVNIRKKHQKPNMQYPEGGIIDKVMPIHISNVMLLDPKTKKPTRIGYKIEDGRKTRIAKKSGTVLN